MVDFDISLPDEYLERLAVLIVAEMWKLEAAKPIAESHRLTLTKAEAAEALGVSVDHLERHVLPDLRIVRAGRLRLIPVAELEAWVERSAARSLDT